MRPLRIVYDARVVGPEMPGVSRAAFGLLRGLTAVDHPHRMLVLARGSQGSQLELALAGDSRFELRQVDIAPFGLRRQQRVPLHVGRFRPDVWHALYYLRPFWGARRALVTAYDLIRPPRHRRLRWEIAMRLSLSLAAHVVTCSAATRNAIGAFWLPRRPAISLVGLGHEPTFHPAGHAVAEPPYLLYVGTNKPHKNVETLVRAWSELEEKHGATLVLAGREDPSCPSPAVRFGYVPGVHCLGPVADSELPALIARAQGFVFPSLAEGFGLPVLEAMACGTPVLSSNRCSLPEVVGDAGLLVDPDVEGLRHGLARLLSDAALRAELRDRGLRRAATMTWTNSAQALLGVYERCATGF